MNFSLQTAREMAEWSSEAYDPRPCFTNMRLDDTPIQRIDNSQTDIHAILICLPDRNFLALRGTHSLRNFFTDTAIDLVPWGPWGMKVHRGFCDAYLSIDGQVMAALDAAPAAPLWITGHSLGAALASLCAFSLSFYHMSRWMIPDAIAAVYPIACPRWANLAGVRAYDRRIGDRTWRITHALDPVPMLPWAAPGWRSELYWKTRQHVWVDDNGFLDINRTFFKELPHAIACAWREEMRGELVPMPDHGIAGYIEALNQAKI